MRTLSPDFIERKNSEKPNLIYLYEIQYDRVANSRLFYTNNPNNITFGGILYTSNIIFHDKVGENLDGKVDKVKLSIGNIDRLIQYYLERYNGLRDCEVKISSIFLEEISNPQCYDSYTFAIADATSDDAYAAFVLASKLDVIDITLPRRKFYRTYCTHQFKDLGCAYSGVQTVCNKTMQRCVELGNVHRFGAFPAIPQKTIFLQGNN